MARDVKSPETKLSHTAAMILQALDAALFTASALWK